MQPDTQQKTDQFLSEESIKYWMGFALQQAKTAVNMQQIPVGCIFIRWNGQQYQKVTGSHNLTNIHQNASRHCQINCFLEMQKILTKQQIKECLLFVTVQPCIMCTFALNLMGIKKAYFGQYNDKFGGCGSLRKDNQFQIQGGVLEQQSFQLIKSFYERGNQRLPQQQRNRGRKKIKTDKE